MGIEIIYFFTAIIVGVGATLIMDLWIFFLKYAFKIPSLSYCLVGRWLLHMPEGTYRHVSITTAQKKQSECVVGWVAHYTIGILFSLIFFVIVSESWLTRPTLLPALFFGIGTVLFPFLIMQPSFGLGVAASRTQNPTKARLKSLMTHVVFGIGLYISAISMGYVFRIHA